MSIDGSGKTSMRRLAGAVGALLCAVTANAYGGAWTTANITVGPQYDTTHVYLDSSSRYDAFIHSFIDTFGGKASARVTAKITPVPSKTQFQYVWSPAGTLSTFSFETPVPYPFGLERTGYLVTDLDRALQAARKCGASVIVGKFRDAIGEDAVVQFPGGINTQLYWHFHAPHYAPLASVPVNRVYVSADAANAFVRSFTCFAHGRVTSNDAHADGAEIGRPGYRYRRIRIASGFGKVEVLVTDGHLPYPFGREITGYGVRHFAAALARAGASGARILWGPFHRGRKWSAIVRFPGGYIAQIHSI